MTSPLMRFFADPLPVLRRHPASRDFDYFRYLITHIPHPHILRSSTFFLMVFWPARGHNHRRGEVSQSQQTAKVLRGSALCLAYQPRSRCTPSTICPFSKPTPTNSASSVSSITMCPRT